MFIYEEIEFSFCHRLPVVVKCLEKCLTGHEPSYFDDIMLKYSTMKR